MGGHPFLTKKLRLDDMTPIEFLTYVWPDEGPYCLAIDFVTRDGETGKRQVTFNGIKAAAREAEAATTGVYFTVHSLKEKRVWDENKLNRKTGVRGGWRVRTHANMAASRCFFFDLDVDPDNPAKFATQGEALSDLKDFCKATGLPKPMVVSSGGGLHVYWRMDEAIPSQEWVAHAEKLKALADHHGLRIDPSRVVDISSILRVVGTFNYKNADEPRRVELLMQSRSQSNAKLLKKIDDAVIRDGVTIVPTRTKVAKVKVPGDGGNLDNLSNLDVFEPIPMKAILEGCPTMNVYAQTRGDVSEPEWYAALGVIAFAKNAEKWAVRLSSGHEDFDPDATLAKLEQVREGQSGATSCQRLAKVMGDEHCKECPFYAAQRTPLYAGLMSNVAPPPALQVQTEDTIQTVTLPDPPKPYKRVKGVGIVMVTVNSDGDEIRMPIYGHDLYPVRRVSSTTEAHQETEWHVVLPKDGEKVFSLGASDMYDTRLFIETLAKNGVYPEISNLKHLQGYMTAYVAELQRMMAAEDQASHLGWTPDRSAFITPTKVIERGGKVRPSHLSLNAERAADSITKAGTLERQVELLRFYDHPAYMGHQFMILAALGAPLIYATGLHGVVVNASGKSGASKSTALYAAASLFGNPKRYTINGTEEGATKRSQAEIVSALANYPIPVDEITHMQNHDAANMVMNISQPQERIRLDNKGRLREKKDNDKATVMICTANSSLHSILAERNTAGTAGSMRVFEMSLKRPSVHSKPEADDFLRELVRNYGHIGEQFLLFMMNNIDELEAAVIAKMRHIDIKGNITGAERFWSGVAAVALVAGEVAYRNGWLPYDTERMEGWLLQRQIPAMRGVVRDEYKEPIDLLANYLEHINESMLVVQTYQNNPEPIAVRDPHGELKARYDRESGRMYLLRAAFQKYCSREGDNYRQVIEELAAPQEVDGVVHKPVIVRKMVKKSLGAGTQFEKARSNCIEIDMTHPLLSEKPQVVAVNQTPDNPKSSKPKLRVVKND